VARVINRLAGMLCHMECARVLSKMNNLNLVGAVLPSDGYASDRGL